VKIAIVQFYPYHEEVMAPQIDFLLPGNNLFIAAPSSVLQNDYISFFSKQITPIEFKENVFKGNKIINFFFRIFSIVCKYFQIYKAHKKKCFDLIIFNTINKPFHFIFIRSFFNNINKIHIIHNSDHYLSQKKFKSLYLFKKNLFISNNVYEYFIGRINNLADPFFFDWFLPTLSGIPLENNIPNVLLSSKINIVVPGSVHDYRRNYSGLFDALKSLAAQEFPFTVILLGKMSSEKQDEINSIGLGHVIKSFTNYIPGRDMLYYIKNADAVAFLIDPKIGDDFQLYNKYKASGSSILCLSFGTPCIVSDHFTVDRDLTEKAITYPGTHIECVFNDILSGKITKELLKKLKDIPLPYQYSHDYQKKHYRKLIGVE
jgi:hypothetical protein